MLKKIISIAFLLLFTTTTVFANTATVENSGNSRYKSVRLTPEIYNNSNADLSDILVKDEKGENVPYFINTGYQVIQKTNDRYPMTLINSYTKDESFYFDYKLSTIPKNDVIATSIVFTTKNIGFTKNIEIFGSYDNINWESVQNDTLYNIDSNQKLEIIFHKLQKYTYYRLKLYNNLEKIAFNAAVLQYNVAAFEKVYFIENVPVQFNVENKDKQTVITLYGLKNVKLDTVTIETDSIFKRNATLFGNTKEIYNLSFSDTTYTDTKMPALLRRSTNDTLTITINNNDDKPININSIQAAYFADEIVFENKSGGNYTIEFGPHLANSPVYDIVSYKDEILKGNIDRLAIKNVKLDNLQEPKKEYDYKWVFNTVIIAVAVLLGVLILLKLRKKV